jgi:polyferredoxin
VCPTGIDIRNGTQMECVNCTACIDACDAIMDRIGRPRGLIRYASLDSIERGSPFRFTPRLAAYVGVLLALAGVLGWMLLTRSDVETTLLRAPGALFQQTPSGKIQNIYTVKVINKTNRQIPVEFRVENVPAEVKVMGSGRLIVPPANLAQTSLLVEIDPAALTGPKTALQVSVRGHGTPLERVQTVFVGPRTNSEQ